MNRYPWIDALKALGIFLVVLGHTTLPDPLHRWIYSFHMPLFFLISGFLVSPGGFSASAPEFFQRRIKKLLIYYAIFGLLGTLNYCYVFRHEQVLSVALRDRFFSLLYASASKGTTADLYPEVLWFFPGLITGLWTTYLLWKIPSRWVRAAAITVVFGAPFLRPNLALPWEFESGCIAAGFLALGHTIRVAKWDEMIQRVGLIDIPLAVVAVSLGSYLAIHNHDCMDIRAARIGNPLLALPACALLISSLTVFAMKFPTTGIAAAVAAATIWIFPTHTLLFPYFDRFASKVSFLHHAISSNSWTYLCLKSCLIVAVISAAHFGYGIAQKRRMLT